MKICFTLVVAAFLSMIPATACAQTNAAPAKPVRFLFLVDNSTSMRRNAEMTEATVGNLIFSGAYGTMRPGDSYTIWTFIDKVEVKEFPVRFWYPNEVHGHTSAARDYIRSLKYSGKGELDQAVSTIKGLAQLSGLVTVFLITDGQAPLYGTPFDLPVTTIYVQHGPTLAKEKKPFVTTFLMVDGKFNSWSVEAAGGKITMPRIPADVFARYYPPEPATAKTTAKTAPVVAPKIVRPPAQSIIVKGPIKSEGNSTTQPTEPVKVLPDPVFPKAAPTTQTLNVLPPTPAIAPTTTPSPAVVTPVLPVAQPAPAPLPPPTVTPVPAPAPAVPTSAPSPAPVPAPAIVASPAPVVVEPKSAPVVATPAPETAAPVAAATTPQTITTRSQAPTTTATSATPQQPVAPAAIQPMPVTIAVTLKNDGPPWGLILGGSAFFAFGMWFLYQYLSSGARPSGQGSIITQSIDAPAPTAAKAADPSHKPSESRKRRH